MKNLDEKIQAGIVCGRCLLAPKVCLCELIPTLALKTKVSLVIHHAEMNRSSNTGRLALEALPNSELKIRGLKDKHLDLTDLLTDEYETLLLYPSEDAQILTAEFIETIDKPIQLIVPDGNWRQASKVHTRHPELNNIKRVMVTKQDNPQHVLRKSDLENGMATLQAIAYALGAIEGEQVQNKLLNLYNEKLMRTVALYEHVTASTPTPK